MLRFGIITKEQYQEARRRNKLSGVAVSFTLLQTDEDASEEDVRMFEEISFHLRTSNGTTRMTFAERFRDVNAAARGILGVRYKRDECLLIQDRAVSHGLTSCEWATQVFESFPNATFEASDLLLHLLRMDASADEVFVVEPNGKPLQYINPPFVVSVGYREPFRYPLNHIASLRGRMRLRRMELPDRWWTSGHTNGYKTEIISCMHPRARALTSREPRFQMQTRSIFDITPGVDVLRTMNILNKAYFSQEKLIEAGLAAFHSVKEGGIWIVGRTLEEDLSNHATFLLREARGWKVLHRVGKGSEIEEFLLATPAMVRAKS